MLLPATKAATDMIEFWPEAQSYMIYVYEISVEV